ncbi:MAG: amidohydrolase family protein [Clostridia bacterium]|nr:amidohydrolase family protein [Clostridia bacterium]
MEYQVFDMHVHVFPDNIAKKAVNNLGKYYHVPMAADGTWEAFRESLAEAPCIRKCLIHSTATKASQVESVNNFVAAHIGGMLLGFGSMHPDYPHIEEEIDRMIELGLRGIKLHTDFQGFPADAACADRIYKYAEGKLPILFHAGDATVDNSSPKRIRNVHDRFPNLTIIAAHLGGYSVWDDAEKYLVGTDVYLDTSSTLQSIDKDQARRMIRRHGVDKCLFGTDFPMHNQKKTVEDFLALGLTEEENRKIFWENSQKLFGVDDRCGS